MPKLLGLSFDFHDAAAAVLIDGVVVAAAQEERFTRRKHDNSLPVNAIAFCLRQAGLRAEDLDLICYYERPLLKFDRVLWSARQTFPDNPGYLDGVLRSWLAQRKFEPRDRIAAALGVPGERVVYTGHHASHAAAAFYSSPFDEAAVVTIDGAGEYETATISVGRGQTIEKLLSVDLPHSLGLFYSAFTSYLGFEVNEGEYKVMGMAGFGAPRHYDALMRLIDLRDDGGFAIDQTLFDFLCPTERLYRPALLDWLGPPRDSERAFATRPEHLPSGTDPQEGADVLRMSVHYADVAASVQKCAETVILHMAAKAMERTGLDAVCMAGGVALNGLANARIINELGARLHVHPAAGDAGSAVGAALHHHHQTLKAPRAAPFPAPYLGRGFDAAAVRRAVDASGFDDVAVFDDETALVNHVAGLLADGCVVGWFQGRAEWGPRALGNRSILADPTRPDIQVVVNEKIKFREPFRPFAPAVLIDRAHIYFDMPEHVAEGAPERHMLSVRQVRPEQRAAIPGVTHVDGTARVQAVSADDNPRFHALISAFHAISGTPILLNTSFNLRGEPIVDSPEDALKTFALSGMDYLVLNETVVSKRIRL